MLEQVYIIVRVSDMSDEMWSDCYQTPDNIELSNDGLFTIISYRGTKPSSFGTLQVYTNSEIIEKKKGPEWYFEVDYDGNRI